MTVYLRQHKKHSHRYPNPENDVQSIRERRTTSRFWPFYFITIVYLIESKPNDEYSKNGVQIVLRRAMFNILWFRPVNQCTKDTLSDVKHIKDDSEPLLKVSGLAPQGLCTIVKCCTLCISLRW